MPDRFDIFDSTGLHKIGTARPASDWWVVPLGYGFLLALVGWLIVTNVGTILTVAGGGLSLLLVVWLFRRLGVVGRITLVLVFVAMVGLGIAAKSTNTCPITVAYQLATGEQSYCPGEETHPSRFQYLGVRSPMPYSLGYEGVVVTPDDGHTNWYLKGGQKHFVANVQTFIGSRFIAYYGVPASLDLDQVPRGDDAQPS